MKRVFHHLFHPQEAASFFFFFILVHILICLIKQLFKKTKVSNEIIMV
jgi:hypothetical protein